MNQSRRASLQQWLKIIAVVVLFCVPFFPSYQDRSRTPSLEEIYWVGQTYYYQLTVVRPDWKHPDWDLIPAWENQQLGRCVIGLGLQLNGLSVTNLTWLGAYYHVIYKGWGEGHERDWRQAVIDRMPSADREMVENQDRFEYNVANVAAGRMVMLFFGSLSVLLVFFLVTFYAGEVVAFFAALLFALHPAVVTAYTYLGVDILAIAFSLLTVLHYEWIRRCVWRRFKRPGLCRALICTTGGLSLAFAVGSKLNATVVGFLGVALCLIYAVAWLRRASGNFRDSCGAMLMLLFVSLLVFVVSNPLNFPHPVSALWKQYATVQRVMEIQEQVLPGALTTWGERFSTMATIVAFHPLGFVLMVGAFLFEVFASWRAGKMPSVIALWWLLAVMVVGAWLPFPRPPHLVPVIAPSVILAGCAVGRLVQTGRSGMGLREKLS